jgi:MerR family transcriptional regulator, copper efflux regulator
MKISELSRRTGVSVHRLRRYEAQGLIEADRSGGGYRQFGEQALREATFMKMGREIGLSLKVLTEALPRYRAGTLSIDQMVEALQDRIAEIDTLVAEQQVLRARLVEHIDWFRERQARAVARADGFPKAAGRSSGFPQPTGGQGAAARAVGRAPGAAAALTPATSQDAAVPAAAAASARSPLSIPRKAKP